MASGKPLWMSKHRSQSGRADPFAQRLFDLEEKRDGGFDPALVDHDHVIDQRGGMGCGAHARNRYCDAFGDRRAAGRGDLPLAQVRGHRREVIALHANHLDRAILRLDDGAHARNQTPTAHCDNQRIQIGHRGGHFERDGSLPGDHQVVVERMDQRLAALLDEVWQGRRSLGKVGSGQDHFSAELGGVLRLHGGCGHRHHDGSRNAELTGVVGDALRMVAGRDRDNPVRALRG